ncbi:MAG: hypothetical protein ACX930_09140 [Erythrobacter sp.]
MRPLLLSLACVYLLIGAPLSAEQVSPREVVERGVAAHGGDLWLEPGTLILIGEATFYSADATAPRIHADDYRMWREMGADRQSAHGADGKVRITATSGERVIFEVGYDGETTWNERGIVPKEQADAFWASNFGFGIIRSALREGFTLESAPRRDVLGREVDLVRIIDPQGAATLFGFDMERGFIRYLAFDTPRGFHERLYDDFVKLENGWVQARRVTLLYDGVMANTVLWTETRVGEPIDAALFAPPEG